MAVHLFGRPVDWEALRAVVPERVSLIEDAAGALGASHRGVPCGALGALACFSFHPRKIVTTGEGGAVVTDDDELDDAVRRLRHHGWVELGSMPAPGFNYRLPDVLCAIGIPQIAQLETLLVARERIAQGYETRLADAVLVPRAADGDRHGWQAYVVQLDRRDDALRALRAAGIEAQIGTWALHRLGPYRAQGSFPGADAAFERALALPFHTKLSDADLDRVAQVLTRL
jgi:dTDP-4-amino-4,6-dideoxygalactose transaminase